jgi:hypothetical protein
MRRGAPGRSWDTVPKIASTSIHRGRNRGRESVSQSQSAVARAAAYRDWGSPIDKRLRLRRRSRQRLPMIFMRHGCPSITFSCAMDAPRRIGYYFETGAMTILSGSVTPLESAVLKAAHRPGSGRATDKPTATRYRFPRIFHAHGVSPARMRYSSWRQCDTRSDST